MTQDKEYAAAARREYPTAKVCMDCGFPIRQIKPFTIHFHVAMGCGKRKDAE